MLDHSARLARIRQHGGMDAPRIGFTFPPTFPPEQLRPAAMAAEAAGLDEFWVWEDCFTQSGIASAAAVLGWTSRIRVAIGLLPVPLRNVGVAAMEIATLDRLFPGRFAAGIGHGVQDWMGQAGVRAQSPMTLLREYAVALRRLLAGERVSMQGRYVHLDDVVLDWPPLQPMPLLIGGAGPKSLQLATQLGDGVILPGNHSYGETDELVGVIRTASAAAAPDITTTQIASTGPGARQRVEHEAAAWDKVAEAGIGVTGGPEEIAESIHELAGHGLSAVTVMPARGEPNLGRLIAVLGQARQLVEAG